MRVYLTNVRIVDGTGAPTIENGLLVYVTTNEKSDERGIIYAGPMDKGILSEKKGNDRIIDLNGEYTVTPGLVNTHVHLDLQMPGAGHRLDPLGPAFRALKAYRRAAESLEVGVTTVRNVGGGDFFDVALKNAIEKGMLNGPRIICCGWTLMAHGGHGSQDYGAIECTGPTEFAKYTRLNLIAGCDAIKVGMTGGLEGAHEGLCDRQVTNEEIEAVIWVAHQAGKKVAAHLSDDQTIFDAVSRGLDSVEHGYAMKEGTVKLIAEKGKYYTPTLAVSSEDSVDYMNKHGFPAKNFAKAATARDGHREAARLAHKHGVKVCVGTDMVPSDPVKRGCTATQLEMELLVEHAEFTPLEVIKAATSVGAELCGVEDITGTIKKGYEADLCIVKGKPDINIYDMRNIDMVVKGGGIIFSNVPGYVERHYGVVSEGNIAENGTFGNW
jgi:imidazolonepropionase-like amidohydrolase